MHLPLVLLFVPTLFLLANGQHEKQCRDNNDCDVCFCCSDEVPNYKWTHVRECDTKWCSNFHRCRRFGRRSRKQPGVFQGEENMETYE